MASVHRFCDKWNAQLGNSVVPPHPRTLCRDQRNSMRWSTTLAQISWESLRGGPNKEWQEKFPHCQFMKSAACFKAVQMQRSLCVKIVKSALVEIQQQLQKLCISLVAGKKKRVVMSCSSYPTIKKGLAMVP
eukprot:477761-Pelagomonas_calceolata.AAC.1